MPHEYAFDVKLFAAIRVRAESEAEARAMIRDHIDGADANLGAWPDGTPILCEVSADGEADLYEVDGEDHDDEPCPIHRQPVSRCPASCDHGEA